MTDTDVGNIPFCQIISYKKKQQQKKTCQVNKWNEFSVICDAWNIMLGN